MDATFLFVFVSIYQQWDVAIPCENCLVGNKISIS